MLCSQPVAFPTTTEGQSVENTLEAAVSCFVPSGLQFQDPFLIGLCFPAAFPRGGFHALTTRPTSSSICETSLKACDVPGPGGGARL